LQIESGSNSFRDNSSRPEFLGFNSMNAVIVIFATKFQTILMKKSIFTSLFLLFFVLRGLAVEGMIIPSLVKAFESDMQALGMKLTAEDLYSVNNSSIKDAIIHFGGGCTAEIVSKQGLIFTNHHCGLGQIQFHSSLQNDYLKNGFWAKSFADELPNPGLNATRIVRIDDVTKRVLEGTEGLKLVKDLKDKINANIKAIIAEEKKRSGFDADIKAFDQGNSYYMLVKETFNDVRLVGAPPAFIGKFGGDTDNWVWPRHTGDFAIFRIYANKENKPADFNKDNVPYKPLHSLPLNLQDRKEGEFTMVYGFPGVTEQHVTSTYLEYIMKRERPAAIHMRKKSLEVIDAGMRSSDAIRIKYASKQARIANAYKKWIGQLDGLENLDALALKQKQEAEFNSRAEANADFRHRYKGVIEELNSSFKIYEDHNMAYAMLIEYVFYGPEVLRLARTVSAYVDNYPKYVENKELDAKKTELIAAVKRHFKDYDATVDQQIFANLTPLYRQYVGEKFMPLIMTKMNDTKLTAAIYKKSMLTNEKKLIQFIEKMNSKSIKKITKDPALLLYNDIMDVLRSHIQPNLDIYNLEKDMHYKIYVEGKLAMFPEKNHWADANSTLRITYGKLEGSTPEPGKTYSHYTTIDGIIEKNKTGNPDFEVNERFLELFENKKFGSYHQNGEMWVCFTGSNHTTGGNSGSPALNAAGHLIGINFDRSWESTMSDFMFDASRCRNIMVDVRYVLWVVDVYAEAGHLIDEMEIIR